MTNDFDKGVAICAAWLINAHGENRIALEMITTMGISLESIEPYDREVIENACANDCQYGVLNHRVIRTDKP